MNQAGSVAGSSSSGVDFPASDDKLTDQVGNDL